MELNENTIKGKWLEIKGDLRKAWGDLTDDELEKTKGNLTSIRGLLQQKLGKKKEDYEQKLDGILKRYEDKKDVAVKDIKKSLK
jgi:uncharacterized protein YjbJ (UPF0337 family)